MPFNNLTDRADATTATTESRSIDLSLYRELFRDRAPSRRGLRPKRRPRHPIRPDQGGGRGPLRALFLRAPNGTVYAVTVNADGALLTQSSSVAAIPNPVLAVGQLRYEMSVDNSGSLLTTARSETVAAPSVIRLPVGGVSGVHFEVTVDGAGALLTERIS